MLAPVLERSACLGAIEHLPEGGTLVMQRVSWSEYERLLGEIDATGRRVRATYDHGRLEIMAPLRKHEFSAELINQMIFACARQLRLPVEPVGSMTIRRPDLEQGVEPDRSYYIRNANAVIGKGELDFRYDPAPDLVVEIDITSESLSKFTIYAALGVGEIWRLTGDGHLEFHLLRDGAYVLSPTSEAFPILDPATLAGFIELGRAEGQNEAIERFEEWLSARRETKQ